MPIIFQIIIDFVDDHYHFKLLILIDHFKEILFALRRYPINYFCIHFNLFLIENKLNYFMNFSLS
jgi:hypothetical protein